MRSQTQVIIIAVELRVMSPTGYILIHSLQLQVATLEEVIHAHGRHIQEAVVTGTVTVEEVVARGHLNTGSHKITARHLLTSQH